jgi:hypothetical protein
MKNLLKTKKLDQRFKANKAINLKTKVVAVILSLIIVLALLFQLGMKIAEWFDTHAIVKQKVLTIDLKAPFRIEERKVPTTEIVRVIEDAPEPEDLETDVEKKIFEVFGIENYKMAISVARAESGLNCNALNTYNSNGTADFSVFQVNSIWIKEYSLAEITDCMRNIEIAYEIWDRADGEVGNDRGSWNPWVAARDGKHIQFMN